jgi:hypothetical protein
VSGVRQGNADDPRLAAYALYDFYGNPVAARDNRIVVPARSPRLLPAPSGAKGSFARLLAALERRTSGALSPSR